mgnify:FL=1
MIDEVGPDHNKKFQVRAQIGSRRYAPAWGRNKKEAEQGAAEKALEALRADGVVPAFEHAIRRPDEPEGNRTAAQKSDLPDLD